MEDTRLPIMSNAGLNESTTVPIIGASVDRSCAITGKRESTNCDTEGAIVSNKPPTFPKTF